MGMEDVRFVKFNDGDESLVIMEHIQHTMEEHKNQLIETNDFNVFKIRTLYGAAIQIKAWRCFRKK